MTCAQLTLWILAPSCICGALSTIFVIEWWSFFAQHHFVGQTLTWNVENWPDLTHTRQSSTVGALFRRTGPCKALPPLSQADRFAYTHKDTLQAAEVVCGSSWNSVSDGEHMTKIRSKLLTLDVWTPCLAMPGRAWPCLQIRLRLPCSRWPITWRPMSSLLVKVSEAVLSPRFPKPHGLRVTLSWDMPICDLLLTVWNLRALWDGSSEICRTLSDIHVMENPACTKMGWPGCQVARWSAFPFYPVLRQGTKRPGQLCLLPDWAKAEDEKLWMNKV